MRAFPDTLLLPRAPMVAGSIELPGSKSLSNRYLLLAALAEGDTVLHGLLASDDTAVMIESLRRLGVTLAEDGDTLRVQGTGGALPGTRAALFVGNSGLTVRTLLPAVAASLAQAADGEVTLSGVPRMHERPIGDLVDGLRALGATVDYLERDGYPPLRVRAAPMAAGTVRVRGDTSSQFLTGLLQAAPLLARSAPMVFEVEGELISKPYVEITLALMARFGVTVAREGWQRFTVAPGQRYRSPGALAVEGDASSASYFLAAGAIGGGPVRVRGAGRDSVQGDVRFADALESMGARIAWGPDWIEAARGDAPLRGLALDCNAIPDAAMTLAACALHAEGPTTLRGIGSWRVKETDRLAAMATELRRFGARVEEGADWLRIEPPAQLQPATVDTYDDHRMAMCLSLLSIDGALREGVPVTVREPGCVAKTFPDFFERLAAVCVPVLTIDGPTASGKGTVAQEVARALGWHYLDSGVLYRLLALGALRRGVALDDEAAATALASRLAPEFVDGRILLDGDDVTDAIRQEAVGEAASRLAVLPGVRRALVGLQKAFRKAPGLVADGRDMGSVIFPDATLKVFLTASAESRAERRYKQLKEKGFSASLPDLLSDLRARDARDAGRAHAPLKAPEGAFELDSTALSVTDTVARVLERLRARLENEF